MIEIIVSKRCSKCCEVKSLSEFRIDAAGRDGYRKACKVCMNAKDAKRYADRKERGIVRSRRRGRVEPLWPLPTHTIQDSLASVQLRKWRGPVSTEPMRASL